MANPAHRPSRSDDGFKSWLAGVVERADLFMAWLGAIFALLVGFQFTVKVRPSVSLGLNITIWLIWAVFVAEYLVKLAHAPAKGQFLRRHWLQVLGLIVPALRVFSFFRLAGLGRALPASRVLASSHRRARRILQSRLGYLSGLAAIVIVGVAELAHLFERRWTLHTFPDALVWAGSVVIGMQANPVPATRPGQVVMLFGFAAGLVLIVTLAGSLAAFLFEGNKDQEPGQEEPDEQ